MESSAVSYSAFGVRCECVTDTPVVEMLSTEVVERVLVPAVLGAHRTYRVLLILWELSTVALTHSSGRTVSAEVVADHLPYIVVLQKVAAVRQAVEDEVVVVVGLGYCHEAEVAFAVST